MKTTSLPAILLLSLVGCTSKPVENNTPSNSNQPVINESSNEVSSANTDGPCGTTDGPQTGEEVFSKVSDWTKIIHWSNFGDIEAIAYYDIDHDGIPEAILRGKDGGKTNYAVCTCGNEKGGLASTDGVKYVVASTDMDRFGIMSDQPFIFISHTDGSAGYETNQYFKIQKSRLEGTYSMLIKTNSSTGTASYDYSCVKNDELVKNFDKKQYESVVPKMINSVVDFDKLEWTSLKSGPAVSENTTNSYIANGESFLVKGGIGAHNFYNAITSYDGQDDEIENSLRVDEKNGFIESFFEGDGIDKSQLCYWKRSDGSILVAYSSFSRGIRHEGDSHSFYSSYSLSFYVYDKSTKMLHQIEWPFDLKVADNQTLYVELPRKGKDINYQIFKSNAKNIDLAQTKTLKFDGMRFK